MLFREGGRGWPTSTNPWLRNWLVAFLMLTIAWFEFQRMGAQERAHRERLEQTIALARIERKVDWMLRTTPPPTLLGPAPVPGQAPASLVRGLR